MTSISIIYHKVQFKNGVLTHSDIIMEIILENFHRNFVIVHHYVDCQQGYVHRSRWCDILLCNMKTLRNNCNR